MPKSSTTTGKKIRKPTGKIGETRTWPDGSVRKKVGARSWVNVQTGTGMKAGDTSGRNSAGGKKAPQSSFSKGFNGASNAIKKANILMSAVGTGVRTGRLPIAGKMGTRLQKQAYRLGSGGAPARKRTSGESQPGFRSGFNSARRAASAVGRVLDKTEQLNPLRSFTGGGGGSSRGSSLGSIGGVAGGGSNSKPSHGNKFDRLRSASSRPYKPRALHRRKNNHRGGGYTHFQHGYRFRGTRYQY